MKQLVLPALKRAEPIFRWTGGKRRLLSDLLPLVPQRYNAYYEPFLGGAAVFFALRPAQAVLGDDNSELINAYRQVKEAPGEVIEELSKLKNTQTEYYRVRDEQPRTALARAARLIYLANLAFNGIYRVNRKGDFNVPYCKDRWRPFFDEDNIRAVSKALSNCHLVAGDFEVAVETAGDGDVAYLDPPYTVAHGNNGFLEYNAKIFSWDDQERLAGVARELVGRGCAVIVSNADHWSIRDLYVGFETKQVERFSGISASGDFRKAVLERVFYKYSKG